MIFFLARCSVYNLQSDHIRPCQSICDAIHIPTSTTCSTLALTDHSCAELDSKSWNQFQRNLDSFRAVDLIGSHGSIFTGGVKHKLEK